MRVRANKMHDSNAMKMFKKEKRKKSFFARVFILVFKDEN